MEPLVINGRYEVIRRLAIGGMGEIFLARQTGMAGFKRLAILKTLRPELSEQDGFLTQFLDEARVAATLNHPNIVAVYEVGVYEGVHFIAMEYIGGIDLSVLQREAGRAQQRVPFRVAASIVCAAAVGLDYAHHAKDEGGQPLTIVHRDVSPQNLMIRPDGVVKVVDFGVAQASNQLHETAADKIKGKIRYMAPEQLAGQDVDGRSDQFSLGIVLWELVTGRPLFSQSSPVEVFQRILSGDLPRAQSLVPDMPDALDAVIGRMMATERAARYARCGDVATALRAFLDGSGGAADDEVGVYVEKIAGAVIADRTKDLTPRTISITHTTAATFPPRSASQEGREDAASGEPKLDTQAATRVMKTEPPRAAMEGPFDDVAGQAVVDRTSTVPLMASLSSGAPAYLDDGAPLDHSDALLSAVEQSGVLHGDRRLATILVGQLPGWGALAAQIANVPMGAFALSRLKNLLMRQLETVVKDHGGKVVTKSTDGFVVAFGVDETRGDDAERAAHCAWSLKGLLEDLGKDPRQRLVAHMGIAGGLCMVADADTSTVGPLQIGGAAVETAEQLAGLAKQNGKTLLATQGVALLCRDTFSTSAVSLGAPGVHEVHGPRAPGAATIERAAIKRVLIVDDADVFRKIEEEILRPFDFAFLHAKDGAQAVKLAVEHLPDLVLLDVQMPVMDGVQVLAFLRKNPSTKDIPIIIITTIGRTHDEELMMRGGASAFLTKPVKPTALVAAVKQLLKV